MGHRAFLRAVSRNVFDSATGTGAVRAHKGVYYDALFAKGNTLVLTLHSLWGGLAPGAVAH
eukprot:2806994-Prymnesium_polylepis.1